MMIRLISNEYNKIGKYKIVVSLLMFLIIIFIIDKTGNNFKNSMYSLIPFIGILCSVYFSGIISNEIENGTIRFYLTKPINRKKIYVSKYLSIIIFMLINCLFVLFMYLFLCKLNRNDIIRYIKYLSPLLFMCSLIIFLSSIFRNSSIVVGISIFVLVFSTLISQILFGLGLSFIEYSFLPYLDFSIFNDLNSLELMNNDLNINLNINFGIIINIIYSIILFGLGLFIFNKKDIRN